MDLRVLRILVANFSSFFFKSMTMDNAGALYLSGCSSYHLYSILIQTDNFFFGLKQNAQTRCW